MTQRQKAIIKELHNRDYFYTRYVSTKENVYEIIKDTYPSVRMKDIEKAIEIEIKNILNNEEKYKNTILGEMYF